MNVFKLCSRFMQQEYRTTTIYLITFVVLFSLINSDFNKKDEKVSVVMLNEDSESALSRHFQSYMEPYVKIKKDKGTDITRLMEDVFYDEEKVVIKLPKDFYEMVMRGENVTIERSHMIETQDTVMVDALISNYIVAVTRCQKKNLDEMHFIEAVDTELSKDIKNSYTKKLDKRMDIFKTYANYLAYLLLSIVFYNAVLLMHYFKKEQIMQHLQVSTNNSNAIYRKVVFSSALTVMLIALVLIAIGGIIAKVDFTSVSTVVIIVNVLVFSFYCVSVSSIIGILLKSLKRMEILVQVFALGLTFFSGVFVKQENLPAQVTSITKYIPVYMYVQINNEWSSLSNINFHDIQKVVIHEVTILCASFIWILIVLIIGEKKVEMDL